MRVPDADATSEGPSPTAPLRAASDSAAAAAGSTYTGEAAGGRQGAAPPSTPNKGGAASVVPSQSASPPLTEATGQLSDAGSSLPSSLSPSLPSEKSDASSLAAGYSAADLHAAAAPAWPAVASSFLHQQQQQQQQQRRGPGYPVNPEELLSRLEVTLRVASGEGTDGRYGRSGNLQDAWALLQLPLDAAPLPLRGLHALLPEVGEGVSPRLAGGRSGAPGPPPAADAPAAAEQLQVAQPLQRQSSPLAGSAAAAAAGRKQQEGEEAARKDVIYAAKRFHRHRRLVLQQVRNRLLSVVQRISDLEEAKEAAEAFLEELKAEVAAARAARQKTREARGDAAAEAQQQEQQRLACRVYFDPRPPASSKPLARQQRREASPRAWEEETASEGGEASMGHEGSAPVERLMQRYYIALMADVDQAAREHVRAQQQGGAGSSCSAGEGGAAAEGPSAEGGGGAPSVGLAPYYFDPFAPATYAPFEVTRSRGHLQQQQLAACAGGSPAAQMAAAAALGAAGPTAALTGSQGAPALAVRSHPMLSAAAEKVRGVAFCKSNRYWICTRMEHGKQQCRYFSVKHLGFECARREAILLRHQWKGDVNEEVLKALEEEKAAMDAAAASAALGGGSSGIGGSQTRTRSAGEAQSPGLKTAAPLTPASCSPPRTPQPAAGGEAVLPLPRKEKTGSVKRRREAASRPLVIDRSGIMPRPPPEFDFASDSDFLTENEEDREEEALAMNATLLAECSERSARAALPVEEEAASQDDSEAAMKRRRREIVSSCFMGVTSTADALVLLSRRLTYAVKIPGISFHKGVESWLCTWKEPDSRTISRYFRCSRFGFRRGFKLSVFTLLLNAPRPAAMRAFLAIKEIKRRRRAALRGEAYFLSEANVVRPLTGDPSEPSENNVQVLGQQSDVRGGLDAIGSLAVEPTPPLNAAGEGEDAADTPSAQPASFSKQQGLTEDAGWVAAELLGVSCGQLADFGPGRVTEGEAPGNPAATPGADPSVNELIAKLTQEAELPLDSGQYALLSSDLDEHAVASAAMQSAGGAEDEAAASALLAVASQHEALGGQQPVTAQYGAA
ncbi:hypothetical protein Efla_001026 [Eimeria flavescens]